MLPICAPAGAQGSLRGGRFSLAFSSFLGIPLGGRSRHRRLSHHQRRNAPLLRSSSLCRSFETHVMTEHHAIRMGATLWVNRRRRPRYWERRPRNRAAISALASAPAARNHSRAGNHQACGCRDRSGHGPTRKMSTVQVPSSRRRRGHADGRLDDHFPLSGVAEPDQAHTNMNCQRGDRDRTKSNCRRRRRGQPATGASNVTSRMGNSSGTTHA